MQVTIYWGMDWDDEMECYLIEGGKRIPATDDPMTHVPEGATLLEVEPFVGDVALN